MRLAINAAGILALTTAVIAQVQVTVTTDKPEYVQGEPIIVVLEVQNESSGPVGYPWDVSVAIPDAHERVLPNLLGCSGGMGGGSGLGRSHEPTLKPGETRRFEYVVRGYDLAPGAYQLQIVGTGGVGWSGRGVGTASTAASGSQSRFRRDYRVVVGERDEARLTEAMARLVAAAQATGQDSAIAKEAILEAAPPFLEPLIAEFAADVQLQHRAVAALGRMNTRASRASLRSMFDSSTDVGLRHGITLSLARTGERDNLELFSRLLRETADSDPTLANYAALGAGFIGGEEAVEGLRWGTSASSTLVRDGVAAALGNTQAADAVDILIAMPQESRDLSAVCGGLTSLTHWIWCDGTADLNSLKARWQWWWTENRSSTRIYGRENCPDWRAALPVVR